MPFVPQENRKAMNDGFPPITVGDKCFLEYQKLVSAWIKNKRWTTAHNEFKRLFDCTDAQAAKTLAYLVFFDLHVMPYEKDKQAENGDVYGLL